METSRSALGMSFGLLLLFGQGPGAMATPAGTAFTYQGWMVDANHPVEGLHDLLFRLFDAPTAGRQIAGPIEVNDVNVVDGHFAVELDFPGAAATQGQQGQVASDVFNGEARWLEIGVRRSLGVQGPDSVPYTLLGPRQRITVAPYALHALSGGGVYDVLRWPSNWNLGVEEAARPPGDAGGQNLFNVGRLGIGTTNPTYPLDVAGAANLNKDRTGIALTVNGTEALWYNGTYFSWGYGGSANFFADPVGIGPETANPAEWLDLSWSGGVNARIGRYNYLGACYSSAMLVLGNNVRARTDGVDGIVVGQPHDSYGYRAITMSTDGVLFHAVTGKVTPGDPLANERMRITNEGKVGIGTTSPIVKLEVAGTIRTSGAPDGYWTHQVWDKRLEMPSGSAIQWLHGPPYPAARGIASHGGFLYIFRCDAEDTNGEATYDMMISDTGHVGIGRAPSSTALLDVNGVVQIEDLTPASGTYVVADSKKRLHTVSSSRRYKTDIRDMEGDADRVLDLRPVRFRWTTTGQEDIGLIAEEVDGVLKDIVIYDQEGRPDAVQYDKVSLYLLQLVKDLKSENESLRQRLEALEKRMDGMGRGDSLDLMERRP